MKEDQIGLNAQIAQLRDALLEVMEELGVESREVPAVGGRPFEGLEKRLVLVE
jgi:hypothetical protein